jgi:hypothetical protein
VHRIHRALPDTLGGASCLLAGDAARLRGSPQALPLVPDPLERLPMPIASFPRFFSQSPGLFRLVPGRLRRNAVAFRDSAVLRSALTVVLSAVNRTEIIRRCQVKVATRSEPPPTNAEIDHGVPMFLDQLLNELRDEPSADVDIAKTATQHGHDLRVQGYTVSEVVHNYGDVCQAVTELAVERQAAISPDDFRTLNRCLDDAIAGAVTEYGRGQRGSSDQDDTFEGARRDTVARDLLKAIQISKFAFDAIRSGSVGVAGSTGTVLRLGLDTAHDLAERLLAEILAPGCTAGGES